MTTAPTTRRRVLILFGGRSAEHPVSCVTAVGVLNALDGTAYEPIPVGITPNGTWTAVRETPDTWTVSHLTGQASGEGGDSTSGSALGAQLPEVQEPEYPVALHRSATELQLVDTVNHEVLSGIDVVFPLLHGPFGEDGTVQGMLETLGVPYVGAGVLASAVGMDKHYMKLAFRAAGLTVGDWVTITDRDWHQRRESKLSAVRDLDFPVFVKPARGGSSLGITRVADPALLEDAIQEARKFDPKVVVEAGILGREIECAVLDGHGTESPRASFPGEIEVLDETSGHQFYDFAAKYQDDAAAELSCPARLPEEAIDEVRRLAVRGFDAVDASGLSRVDFFYTQDGRWVINEINTMPGFTPISMYPAMWHRSGVSYSELIHELIELGVERGTGLH